MGPGRNAQYHFRICSPGPLPQPSASVLRVRGSARLQEPLERSPLLSPLPGPVAPPLGQTSAIFQLWRGASVTRGTGQRHCKSLLHSPARAPMTCINITYHVCGSDLPRWFLISTHICQASDCRSQVTCPVHRAQSRESVPRNLTSWLSSARAWPLPGGLSDMQRAGPHLCPQSLISMSGAGPKNFHLASFQVPQLLV